MLYLTHSENRYVGFKNMKDMTHAKERLYGKTKFEKYVMYASVEKFCTGHLFTSKYILSTCSVC